MIGIVLSGYQLPFQSIPELTYIYANQGTPSISYTHTVQETGYYLGISMRGDSGYTCTTTGTTLGFITGGARSLVIALFECQIGNTCTVMSNNYSGNTNCRAEIALFKLGRKINLLSTLYNAQNSDATKTYSYTFSPGKYLTVYGMCGNTSNYTTLANKTDSSPSGTQLLYNVNEWKSTNGCNFYVAILEIISGNLTISNGGSCGTAGGMNMVVFSIS